MLGRWTILRRVNVTWQRWANGSTDVVPTLAQRQLASWAICFYSVRLKIKRILSYRQYNYNAINFLGYRVGL